MVAGIARGAGGRSLGEVNEPPPRRILFPSTTITHAESTNQERKQHGDSEYKPTRFDGIEWTLDTIRVLLSSFPFERGE